ncbi:hypothetical protein RND81_14G075500 [Saponaria officinalis]|uniref:Uncharacterized protein n=1 Tax=Saponaria officinalis TaxID=3572 RepID=A0AAW1GKE1_SAPOF
MAAAAAIMGFVILRRRYFYKMKRKSQGLQIKSMSLLSLDDNSGGKCLADYCGTLHCDHVLNQEHLDLCVIHRRMSEFTTCARFRFCHGFKLCVDCHCFNSFKRMCKV